MSQFDPTRAPVEELQRELGKALAAAIDKQGGKVAFARRTGLSRATLYRLLRGENVSTDVLLRTLRGLGRAALLLELTASPEPSPLELWPAQPPRRRARTAGPAVAEGRSLVTQLTLGRSPNQQREEEDG